MHQLPLAEGIRLVCRGLSEHADINFLEITGELSQKIQSQCSVVRWDDVQLVYRQCGDTHRTLAFLEYI
jgi:hypothetical protein